MDVSYVDLETARAAGGLRLVTLAGVPSPWAEAAKGIFHLDQVPFVAVKLGPKDQALKEWARADNAPVAIYENEPQRTGWAAILELAERLSPAPTLIPKNVEYRVRHYGLCHEVMGEGGLQWSSRLLSVHAGITSNGERGFHPRAAAYLGARYGYREEKIDETKKRFEEGAALLVKTLGARDYYIGEAPTALDVYSAAALNTLVPLPNEVCPIAPPIRAAFESMSVEYKDMLAPLAAHRDRMYERHLGLPILN